MPSAKPNYLPKAQSPNFGCYGSNIGIWGEYTTILSITTCVCVCVCAGKFFILLRILLWLSIWDEQIKIDGGYDQGCREGRAWTHLLHWEHWNSTICRATTYENALKTSKKRCSTTKDLKGLQKMSRRGMDSVIKTHTPIEVTHKQEDNHNCRGSLQEAKDLPLIKLGFPAWGSCMRKAGHQNIWHWKCHGREACIWESQGTVGNRDSSFKGCVQRLYMEARFRLNALIF